MMLCASSETSRILEQNTWFTSRCVRSTSYLFIIIIVIIIIIVMFIIIIVIIMIIIIIVIIIQ